MIQGAIVTSQIPSHLNFIKCYFVVRRAIYVQFLSKISKNYSNNGIYFADLCTYFIPEKSSILTSVMARVIASPVNDAIHALPPIYGFTSLETMETAKSL